MTIEEAFKQGIYRLRREPWARSEYIELQVNGEHYSPMATLHSILNSEDVPEDIRIPPQDVPLWAIEDDGWEPYTD